ncbi:MAG: hypothetical protein ACEPOV_08195 [Hyphomicrobiales bacterium]
MKKLFILILMFWAFTSNAQDNQLNDQRYEAFFESISNKLLDKEYKEYKEKGEDLLEKINVDWLIAPISEEQRLQFYDYYTSLDTNYKATYPVIYEYLYSMWVISKLKLDSSNIAIWMAYLKQIPELKNDAALLRFLRFTSGFLLHGQMHSKSYYRWAAKNMSFAFEYDSLFKVKFEKLDLYCLSNRDSIIIKDTKGEFDYLGKKFKGTNGKATWDRFNVPSDELYVEVDKFEQDFNSGKIFIDSVRLYNSKLSLEGISGFYQNKIYSDPPNKIASYPRFYSYEHNFVLEDIFKGITYFGGIGMKGNSFEGSIPDSYPELIIKRGDDEFIRSKSKIVKIEDSKLIVPESWMVLNFKNDSIFHPNVLIEYEDKRHEYTLSRDDRGYSNSPFFDSYHNINIYSDVLKWKRDSTEIIFEAKHNVQKRGRVEVFSSAFYDIKDTYLFQGVADINPLFNIKGYIKKNKTRDIDFETMMKVLKMNRTQTLRFILRMTYRRLCIYNRDERMVHIKNEFYEFILAEAGLKDYDIIKFKSIKPGGRNVVMNIDSLDLNAYGVDTVVLNAKLNVKVIPKNSHVELRNDRNFSFDGTLIAGDSRHDAENCDFIYRDFTINLNQINSLKLKGIKGEISDSQGTLYISDPKHKSGEKVDPKYPIFDSEGESFIYYDKIPDQGKTLVKDRFRYHLDPFDLKGLNNLSKDSVNFTGYLESAGIFPDIDEPLDIKSGSFGFVHETPEEGLDIYEGRGKYYDKIYLSYQGFYGAGKLEYLTSNTHSRKFVFYPDSLRAKTDYFAIKEQMSRIEFPPAKAHELDQKWRPYKDKMYLTTLNDKAINFYDRGKFAGVVTLAPYGCKGKGKFDYDLSTLESRDMDMKHHSLRADTANFNHHTKAKELAFSSRGYGTNIDFEKREGVFTANGPLSVMEFPFNQYFCSMDEILWRMDDDVMDLNNKEARENFDIDTKDKNKLIDMDLTGSDFVSTHPDQDSLSFFSLKAKYDMKNYVIHAEGVKLIKVADAAVFPADENIDIEPDAYIPTFENAYVIADTASKLHRIYDATITISSKHSFEGSGMYDYVDINGGVQPINLTKVSVDTNGRTIARGVLKVDEGFKLNPYYYYSGQAQLYSLRKDLLFDGAFMFTQDCSDIESGWVKMKKIVNPRDVRLPVSDTLYDRNDTLIDFGLIFSDLEYRFYPALFKQKQGNDQIAFSASGVTFFDTISNSYIIGREERFKDTIWEHQYLSMNIDSCIVSGEGKINFLTQLDILNLETAGAFRHIVADKTTYFNVLLSLDFFFKDNLLEMVASMIDSENNTPVDIMSLKQKKRFEQSVGTVESDKFYEKYRISNVIKHPPTRLIKSMVFNDVNFTWNNETKSYISSGPIGVGNFLKTKLYKYVDGYIEIGKQKTGSKIKIYLEASPDKWVYFSYEEEGDEGKMLRTLSSLEEYNNTITSLPDKKKLKKGKKKIDNFRFDIASEEDVYDFIDRMKSLQ